MGFDVILYYYNCFICVRVEIDLLFFSGDPMSNMKVQFSNKEDAIAYCEKNGWQWFVQEGTVKPMRPKSYGVNFSWNKRTRTSTK